MQGLQKVFITVAFFNVFLLY